MAKFDIDEHIKKQFALFEGKRSQEEDQKIYDKVYSLVLNEMILFVGQNVSKDEMGTLSKRLDTEDPKTVLSEALEKVPGVKHRLDARIRYFVNKLLIDSVKSRQSIAK